MNPSTLSADPASMLQLVEQAREAYEQKRTRDCIELSLSS
jgi:hypothetical protein